MHIFIAFNIVIFIYLISDQLKICNNLCTRLNAKINLTVCLSFNKLIKKLKDAGEKHLKFCGIVVSSWEKAADLTLSNKIYFCGLN